MFDGQVESEKRIKLLYDEALPFDKQFIRCPYSKVCLQRINKGCECGVTHMCQETCSDCMSVPPCPYAEGRIPCESCNRRFRSRAYFEKHKTNKLGEKSICEQKRNCAICNNT